MATKKTEKTAAKPSLKLGNKPTTTALKRAAKRTSAKTKIAAKTQVRLSRTKIRATKKNEKEVAANPRQKVKVPGHAPHSARITAPKGPVQGLASKTQFGPKYSDDRKWVVVDAAGQTVGRLASEIAMILRGKHKAIFTPNNDCGDFVIVLNCEKVVFKAAKETDKIYHWHSGYISGLKEFTPERLRTTFPDRILRAAVRGMIPRSPLGRDMMSKLNIYAGNEHPHAAQKPTLWQLRYTNKEGQ